MKVNDFDEKGLDWFVYLDTQLFGADWTWLRILTVMARLGLKHKQINTTCMQAGKEHLISCPGWSHTAVMWATHRNCASTSIPFSRLPPLSLNSKVEGWITSAHERVSRTGANGLGTITNLEKWWRFKRFSYRPRFLSSINLSCLRAVFTNCTNFKLHCIKKYVQANGREN